MGACEGLFCSTCLIRILLVSLYSILVHVSLYKFTGFVEGTVVNLGCTIMFPDSRDT